MAHSNITHQFVKWVFIYAVRIIKFCQRVLLNILKRDYGIEKLGSIFLRLRTKNKAF